MPPSPHAETILDAAALRESPLPDDEQDDKHGRGTVLVIGGSATTPGAALLAGEAALRVGAGRLQIATAAAVAPHLAVAVPEALVTAFDSESSAPLLRELIATADAVVIGPGLSDLEQAHELLATVLDHVGADSIVVIDAMGLDALVARPAPVDGRVRVIVTPNRDELARMRDGETTEQPPEYDVARQHGVTVVSFGRVVTADGRGWLDPGEVSGLGTSGAGDILAGAIGGVAARSHDVLTAAAWGVLSHRIAANRAAEAIAPVGYLAREIVSELPGALAGLQASAREPARPDPADEPPALGE